MTKRYVIVQESFDESGQRGVDAVYVGPGSGWVGWEARIALTALTEWLSETRQTNGGTRVTIVQTSPVPDRPRGRMARAVMEADAAQRARLDEARAAVQAEVGEPRRLAVVESVDPPISELWDTIKDSVTPDEVWKAASELGGDGYLIPDDVQRQVLKNREQTR